MYLPVIGGVVGLMEELSGGGADVNEGVGAKNIYIHPIKSSQ